MREPRGTLLALVAALSGCAMGKDYARPETAAPASLDGAARVSSATSVPAFTREAPVERWWEVFKEPALDQLVQRAREGNQGLQAAIARVQAARAVARGASSPLLPTISGKGQYLYEKSSRNTIGFPVSKDARPFRPSDFYSGTLDLGYELDLWGRLRRDSEAAGALAQATDEDRKSIELALVADTCEAYFDLGAASARLAIARETVGLRERSFDLVKARYDAGAGTELDLRRAEGELELARAEVPEAARERAIAEHRLAILTGHPPDVRFFGKPPAAFALPPSVPIGIPSGLLERRPDVRAAEQRVVAANAEVGAAIAAFFPRVSLVGQIGHASLLAGRLPYDGSSLFSLGPSISVPIFEGGATYARLLEREALTSEAVANYRDVVLRAFGEVADAIAGVAARSEVRDRQAAATEAARRALELAEAQYASGAASYLTVLDAARGHVDARRALLETQRLLLSDLVKLEKALGGGWSELEDKS